MVGPGAAGSTFVRLSRPRRPFLKSNEPPPTHGTKATWVCRVGVSTVASKVRVLPPGDGTVAPSGRNQWQGKDILNVMPVPEKQLNCSFSLALTLRVNECAV